MTDRAILQHALQPSDTATDVTYGKIQTCARTQSKGHGQD